MTKIYFMTISTGNEILDIKITWMHFAHRNYYEPNADAKAS